MSFYENLSKFARSVGDGASNIARRSGEAVEITKFNLTIKNQEEEIEIICTEIGKIIYNKYQNGETIDNDLIENCKRIDDLYGKIELLKQKVLEIRNIKICKGCNREINIDIEFCPKCGTKQKNIKKGQKNIAE